MRITCLVKPTIPVENAAQLLRRSVATVYRLARGGRIRRVRVVGRTLLLLEDIERVARELDGQLNPGAR